jgi:transposase
MSSIHRESVREEAERIKEEFTRLASSKKMDTEVVFLVQSMLTLINLLIAIFMEKTTKKNNKNSSIPSSQTDKDETNLNTTETKGKGLPEVARVATNTRTVEQAIYIPVTVCAECGADLEAVSCDHVERRTKIDIVFEKVVDHVDVEVKQCPICDTFTQEHFPKEMTAPLCYGAGIKAYVINLIVCQMLSLNRTQKMLQTLIDEKLSEASLLKFVLRLYEALALWESHAIDKLLALKALNVDETSLRVDKKNQWIHVYSGEDITLKMLHPKRGLEAIESINIIPRYSGKLIHDCWASYLSYDHCGHGLCGSHLVRELTAIIDANHYAWAMNMKRLLLETCKRVANRKNMKIFKNVIAIS